MIPNVDKILSDASAVTNIVSNRIYRTLALQPTTAPYIVWSIVSTIPENNLADLPELDDARIQIDCYSVSQPQARTLSNAAQAAIEAVTHVVMGPIEFFEPDTLLYRFTFDATFWTNR